VASNNKNIALKLLGFCFTCLFLPACSSSGDEASNSSASVASKSAICLEASCGQKLALVDIPSAENLLFTTGGRLFVTGANVYEITRRDGAWHAQPLMASNGNFTGLAQINDVLYVNSFDGLLYAAKLTAAPSFEVIHDQGHMMANGLTAGPNGELYSVVSLRLGLPLTGQIIRLGIDKSNPFNITEQVAWFTMGVVHFMNGLQQRDGAIFFSSSELLPLALGKIVSVPIQANGSAGSPKVVAQFNGIPDDFSFIDDDLLVAVYSNNQILRINPEGRVISKSELLSFDNPSQVRQGQAPMFSRNELVITEKGLIGLPPTPGYGNRLSSFVMK
jgi:hypothetical protein